MQPESISTFVVSWDAIFRTAPPGPVMRAE
jgi:hypothetical protein